MHFCSYIGNYTINLCYDELKIENMYKKKKENNTSITILECCTYPKVKHINQGNFDWVVWVFIDWEMLPSYMYLITVGSLL